MSPRRTPLLRSAVRLGLRTPRRTGVGERRARELVRSRAAGWCETCCAEEGTEWHHRKNRSQGGRWAASNGLLVCPGCHRWITTHPRGAQAKGWSVKSHEVPAAVPVWRWGDWVLLADDGSISDFPIGGAR